MAIFQVGIMCSMLLEACHFITPFLVLIEETLQEGSLDFGAPHCFGEAENVSHLHQLLPIMLCAAPHSSN